MVGTLDLPRQHLGLLQPQRFEVDGIDVDRQLFPFDADAGKLTDVTAPGAGAQRGQGLQGVFAHNESTHAGVAAQNLEVELVVQLLGEHFPPLLVADTGLLQ